MRSSVAKVCIRGIVAAAALGLGAGPLRAESGPEPAVRRVAILATSESESASMIREGIRDGLLRSRIPVLVEQACGEGAERAAETIRRWRSEGVELFFAVEEEAALLLMREVKDKPVVFACSKDPVLSGVVKSLDPTVSNAAGACLEIDLGEVLRLFRDAVPGLRRLGVLLPRGAAGAAAEASRAELALAATGLEAPGPAPVLVRQEVDRAAGEAGLREAVNALSGRGVQAVWLPDDPFLKDRVEDVARFANEARLPLLATHPAGVRRHVVAGIAPDYRRLGVKAAALAAKVLRDGEDPGKLPVGVVRAWHVIVNLKAAERARVVVSIRALTQADVIITRDGW
jgi:putative ABC transport system substrate-binding protein